MDKADFKALTKYCEDLIKKTIKASKSTVANHFLMTEKRLYAFSTLEKNIENYLKDIEDVKVETFGHAKDIIIYSPSGGATPQDIEEVRKAKIKVLQGKIYRDREELKELKRALARIKDEEYYKIIRYHYFDKLDKDSIAKKMNCSETTAWRQRKRLVNILSLVLYGADILK